MLPWFLLGVGLLVGFALLFRGFLSADPRTLAKVVRVVGIVLVGVVFVVLTATGRLGTALAIGAFVLPVAMRWNAIRQHLRAARGPNPGQRSQVETMYLRMVLDHDTGAMTGEVIRGPFAGTPLARMTRADLLRLLDDVRTADPQSAAVLETYLDRVHPDWRADAAGGGAGAGEGPGAGSQGRSSGAGRGAGGAMTREEAYEILGLSPGAAPEEIKDAHRRLMLKNHPDQGGSTYLAAKINQAKDLLLRG
jgi:hypothetical protein